jgi:hypothetical protein
MPESHAYANMHLRKPPSQNAIQMVSFFSFSWGFPFFFSSWDATASIPGIYTYLPHTYLVVQARSELTRIVAMSM